MDKHQHINNTDVPKELKEDAQAEAGDHCRENFNISSGTINLDHSVDEDTYNSKINESNVEYTYDFEGINLMFSKMLNYYFVYYKPVEGKSVKYNICEIRGITDAYKSFVKTFLV